MLKAIGELPTQDVRTLALMAPKLADVFGRTGTWDAIIAEELHLPADMPRLIADLWQRNLIIARESGTKLSPQQFAEMFADDNFGSML